jgi:hypothetical protein
MFCGKGVRNPVKSKCGLQKDGKHPAFVHKKCEDRMMECCAGAMGALRKIGL